jgi:signal transduction histidine kinase
VEPNGELQQSINEFWKVVAGIPDATRPLDAPRRYAYIQTEIVPRRNATGDLVRDFAIADQKSLAESELAFARTRRASAQRLMATLGFTLLAGLVVALFSLTYASGLERKATAQYEEVERAKRELQQLSAQLMNIQEEERMRLSRELHDEVGQMIATARLEILRAETLLSDSTGDARARLSRARELTGRTMEAIRDICVLLRPALLDDLGLSPALQWQVEDFTVRTGIPCELTESALDDPELPDAVKTCVYRVLQEALHNCEKHSRATLVTVRVGRADDVLQLSIEDNGAGLPLANEAPAPVAHLGLLGMRERATQLGGNVAIASSPGKGTRLTLMLPLKPVTSAAATAGGRV